MSQKASKKKQLQKREVVLRLFAYGIPIAIGILGFVMGWWQQLGPDR